MKKKTISAIAAVAAVAGFGITAGTVEAAPGNGQGNGSCVKAGLETLRSLDALPAAAQGAVDYSAFADAEEGPIFADLPEGSFLPLNAVIGLHLSNPELFAWCR